MNTDSIAPGLILLALGLGSMITWILIVIRWWSGTGSIVPPRNLAMTPTPISWGVLLITVGYTLLHLASAIASSMPSPVRNPENIDQQLNPAQSEVRKDQPTSYSDPTSPSETNGKIRNQHRLKRNLVFGSLERGGFYLFLLLLLIAHTTRWVRSDRRTNLDQLSEESFEGNKSQDVRSAEFDSDNSVSIDMQNASFSNCAGGESVAADSEFSSSVPSSVTEIETESSISTNQTTQKSTSRSKAISLLGLDFSDFKRDCYYGLGGFLASLLPVYLCQFFLTYRGWSGEDDRHGILKLMLQNPSLDIVLLFFVLAVVLAPLSEELIFRVILQGTAHRYFSTAFSICSVSLLFSFVHGWPNAVPLFSPGPDSGISL